MAHSDARVLLDLADFAAARRRTGVTLDEIEERFSISRRSAQRLTRTLEAVFPETEVIERPDRRRAWTLPRGVSTPLAGLRDEEVAALDLAIRQAAQSGAAVQEKQLRRLSDRLRAAAPGAALARAEVDADALLQSSEFIASPGPVAPVAPGVVEAVHLALKGPFVLRIHYRGAGEARDRLVKPHGVLLGARRYLVAPLEKGDQVMRHWRLDRVVEAEPLSRSFVRDAGFNLSDHAAGAFGAFHDRAEYGEVVWRFRPEAAARAAEFRFHPRQALEHTADGSLIVRFHASGWTEMAWHLYQWGDRVEVLAPDGLRRLVEGWIRSDLPPP